MKVLVMGGTRFNGLALVNELVKHGHDVTIFNRGVSEAVIPRAVRRLYGDRTQHEQLTETMRREDFDVVQDISGYAVDDVRPLFEAFKGRIGHYIFAGSTVIYADTNILPIRESHPLDEGPKQGDYGKNKMAVERWLFSEYRQNGFPATVVSFSMVFGPNNIIAEREQRMYSRLLAGRPVLIPGDGTTLQQIGHVEDEARALRMAMMNPNTFGKRYNVTGKDYWTDEGYVDVFADTVGVQPEKVFIPRSLMNDLWEDRFLLEGETVHARPGVGGTGPATAGRPPGNIRFMNSLVQRLNPAIHGWHKPVVFSIDRMREDFGFEPEFTFRSAVDHTYEWYRREGLDKTRQFDWSWEDALLEKVRSVSPTGAK